MTLFRPYLLRLLAMLAVVLQLATPFAQAQAAANGTDLASLICNPSGQAASSEAKAALGELLDAIGETDPAETSPDCQRCVTPHVAIPSLESVLLDRPVFSLTTHRRPESETSAPIAPRGPPCGTRAPPTFV